MWRKHKRLPVLAMVIGAALIMSAACGDDDGDEDNRAPEIVDGISIPTGAVTAGDTIVLQVISVNDPDGDAVVFAWQATLGEVNPVGPTAQQTTTYTAPNFTGSESVTVTVSDSKGGTTTSTLVFPIVVAADDPTPTAQGPLPTVEIASPTDGSQVQHTTQVRGTSSNVLSNHDIWLMVQPHQAAQFHPQAGPIAQQADGGWTGPALFGESASRNVGEGFELIVVLATREASQAFREYLDPENRNGSFPGLAFLPEGAEIMDQITVTRQ